MVSSVPPSTVKKLAHRSALSSDKAQRSWWNNQDVQFSCSDGSVASMRPVWLNVDECADLCFHLNENIRDIADKYFTEYKSGGPVKECAGTCEGRMLRDGCVFLDDEGKKRTIYEARPVHAAPTCGGLASPRTNRHTMTRSSCQMQWKGASTGGRLKEAARVSTM